MLSIVIRLNLYELSKKPKYGIHTHMSKMHSTPKVITTLLRKAKYVNA
jgi:hypothetical protein